MRKATIGIGISLIFYIGIFGQASAQKIQCWDLNENHVCDIAEEDINNDGKCSKLDCDTEPSEVIQRLETIQQTLDFEVIPKLDECCGYSVPKTGQTTSYASGDDGAFQRGVSWPNPRFKDNGDGTVIDTFTGFVWLKNANCFGTRKWADAFADCNSLKEGDCGLTDGSSVGDWSLPNVRELHSLIDFGQNWPALSSGHLFVNVQSVWYWSSTTCDSTSLHAWHVNVRHGDIGGDDKNQWQLNVWPVRNPK